MPGWACSRTRTPSTTTTSRSAAPPSCTAIADGMPPATPPATARRCTSSARSSPGSSPRDRRRGRTMWRGWGRSERPSSRRGTSARRSPWSRRLPPEGGGTPTILAMGGGGFTAGPATPRSTSSSCAAGRARPRVCLLPTAGGDSEHQIRRFYETFGDRLCEPSHIRCSASAGGRSRCASTCWPRTRSTSAAARW